MFIRKEKYSKMLTKISNLETAIKDKQDMLDLYLWRFTSQEEKIKEFKNELEKLTTRKAEKVTTIKNRSAKTEKLNTSK